MDKRSSLICMNISDSSDEEKSFYEPKNLHCITYYNSKLIPFRNKCNRREVVQNKSSLLLKIILQNTQTLQLFTKIIKTGSIHKSYYNTRLEGLGSETKGSN
jgi:hypothetical protein